MKRPQAYDESKEVDPFWKKGKLAYVDPGDKLIPSQPGFLSDMVYYMRGYEVPTTFCLWVALFLVANVLKRDAYVKWGDDYMYSNLYLILIGEAGHVKKTTAITKGVSILKEMRKVIARDVNKHVGRYKETAIIENKATPEAILNEALSHSQIPVKDGSGNTIKSKEGAPVRRAAEITLVVPEMSVMFNKQTYNESMMQNMLDLYDPHEEWGWATKSEGKKTLRKVLTNMVAATTKDGFRDALPKAALGDGFLSRVILVYEDRTKRIFPRPRLPEQGVSKEEMARRLAYVATTVGVMGEFAISEEAEQWYDDWYIMNRKQQDKLAGSVALVSRKPVMLLKLALLMAAQRYDQDLSKPEITVADFKDAQMLLDATYKTAPLVLRELQGGTSMDEYERVLNLIKRNPEKIMSRRELQQGAKVKSEPMRVIIVQLFQDGLIELYAKRDDGTYIVDSDRIVRFGGQCYGAHPDLLKEIDNE